MKTLYCALKSAASTAFWRAQCTHCEFTSNGSKRPETIAKTLRLWICTALSRACNSAGGGNGNHCYTPSGQGNRGGCGGGGGGNLSGPGGGGGYTGGNSSGYWSSYSQHGGGAGSFNNGQNQVNTRGGNSSSAGGYSGAGYVTIQFL